MPLYNVTIDDASALIGYYNPNGMPWKDSPTNDSALGEYSDHTYHSSNQSGAWSTFRFQGTAVYLFAATRIMHVRMATNRLCVINTAGAQGKYHIFMDDQHVYEGDGYTRTSIFNQLVFNATSLLPGWHNLTFVNAEPGRYIEVDYIRWTTVMSAALTETSGTPIPHTLGNMTYDASIWDESAPGSKSYMVTKTNGATVNITFKGNGVDLYGRTGPEYGVFSAQIDNLEPQEFDAHTGRAHDTMLFRQDNLPDGNHTLVVTNRGNSLAIASALPILWQGGPQRADGKLIAAIIISLALGMILLALLWFWYARRQHGYEGVYTDDHFLAPRAYEPTFESTPFIFPIPPSVEQTAPHSLRDSDQEPDQGTIHPARYHALPTSPGPASPLRFEYHPSITVPLPPGYDRGPGSSRPYVYDTSPVIYGNTRPPTGKRPRPVVPAIRTQAQSPETITSLRDSDAGPIILPPPYIAAITSRGRD